MKLVKRPGAVRALVLGLCALGIASVALPRVWATMVPFSLDQITADAEEILVGKVTALSNGYIADWPRVGKVVFTDVTIAIEERWKGENRGETIQLQVPGGTLADGRRMEVSDAPRFAQGERVLVFCARKNGRNWVHAWDQGKYEIVRERVVGKTGYPIGEDILTDPLRRKIQAMLERKGK